MPPNGQSHDPPYPAGGDAVPYREFAQLSRRVDMLEQRAIGETLVRLEERQANQGQRLGSLEQAVHTMASQVDRIEKAETQRAGFRLGTKELLLAIGAFVTIIGTIVAVVVAVAQLA